MMPFLLGALIALTIGTTAVGYAASRQAAEQQNKAMKASMAATRAAAEVGYKQVLSAAEIERRKRINETRLLQSRIRVASGEAGIGTAGTYLTLMRQADIDLGVNLEIMRENVTGQLARVATGAQADLAQLSGMYRNPLLQGLVGAMGGLTTGLSITQSGLAIAGEFKRAT